LKSGKERTNIEEEASVLLQLCVSKRSKITELLAFTGFIGKMSKNSRKMNLKEETGIPENIKNIQRTLCDSPHTTLFLSPSSISLDRECPIN
jgi:hypothetical protein